MAPGSPHNAKKAPSKGRGGQFLFSSSIDHFQNEIHGTIDPVAGGVDAEVIVIGMAPLSSRIEIIIPGMPPVQAVEEPSGPVSYTHLTLPTTPYV